jgi:hypothetical protein
VNRRELITLIGSAARLCFWEDQVFRGSLLSSIGPRGNVTGASLLAEVILNANHVRGAHDNY